MSTALDYRQRFYDLKAKAEERREPPSAVISRLGYETYARHRPALRGLRCLDVAVGSGWTMHDMLAQGAAHCDGIDIAPERVTQASELLAGLGFKNHRLWVDDAERLEQCADAAYDYINCLDLIEHLQDWRGCMMQMHRVLKPGGRIYIKTPNDFTDTTLRWHHGQALLFSSLLPGRIAPPAGNELFLRDDVQHLSPAEQEELREATPEGFHEHIHQFAPDELVRELAEHGFVAETLAGTPLGIDILFLEGAHLPATSALYAQLVESGVYGELVKALHADLMTSGLYEHVVDLPAEYILSDNLIIVARKQA